MYVESIQNSMSSNANQNKYGGIGGDTQEESAMIINSREVSNNGGKKKGVAPENPKRNSWSQGGLS